MRVLFAFTSLLLVSTATAKATQNDHAQAVIEWLRSKENGYFNDKLQIRPADPNSHFGMFATEKISAKELLLRFPRDVLITVEDTGDYSHDLCALAKRLQEEMELGDESKYAPYVKYLKEESPGQIPSTWSAQGKRLLQAIISDKPYGSNKLPPQNAVNLLDTECDPDLQHYVALVIQRGWDTALCPIYDMINHNNGAVNTENTSVRDKEGFSVFASKEIQPGEEIFNTYDKCLDCQGVDEIWGTPEILRDFGFVENYPQRWHFGHDDLHELISFNLDQTTVDGVSTLQVEWIHNKKPDEAGMKFLEEQYQRLDYLVEEVMEPARESVPDKEWNLIIQFHEAMMAALSSAMGTRTCGLECYGEDQVEVIENVDENYKEIYQCETLTFGIDHYRMIDTVTSQYQKIDYFQDPATNDTCFHLDDIFQMCGCYWPHYHEMVVHKTAKYLKDDIKRVLWVGGGDSGLLNEIIKYPSLELVVGLELDQKVTRGAFKHFGAEPHYDNEKVQWWYGDASKSLLMLPKDYFGTFDMVLVDLSDTVFALSVSKDLDVIGALSLLLRPGGVFEMNELIFESVSNAFEYTIHYTYQDVPKVCDQSLIIASNDVDFLHQELTERNIENLLVETSSHKTKHRFDMVHDYRKNDNSAVKKLCKQVGEAEQEPVEQKESPGILMIIETENVSEPLESVEAVKNAVVKALEKEGFGFLSSAASDDKGGAAVIVLREGYVVARTWPEHKYCAFDIHLWSSFEKHEAAKKALIKSVGGEIGSTSSYRIVAGGMFGVSTWKDDLKSHGPHVTQLCNQSATPAKSATTEPSIVGIALEEGLRLVQEENIVVAVVCGHDTKPCESIDLLKRHKDVLEVVPLHTCTYVKPEEVFFENFQDRMAACRLEVLKKMQDSLETLTDEKKFQAIVVDKGAPSEMGEIVQKIFKSKKNVLQLLAPGILVMATIEDRTEAWRRKFVNNFRKEIVIVDPVYTAQVVFKESSLEMGITSSGDTHFIEHLTGMVSNIEKKTGLAVDIKNIVGGWWRRSAKYLSEDSEFSQYFLPGDLPHSSLERWRAQQPLGHQTVIQLQQSETFEAGEKVLGNFEGRGEWHLAEVQSVSDYNTYHLEYDDGDEEFEVMPQMIRKPTGEESLDDALVHALPSSAIVDAFKHTLSSMESEDMSSASTHVFKNVGDGCFLVALWSGGVALVVWDGRVHVDINLFTHAESVKVADEFAKHFTRSLPGLAIILRDEQPRGTGRVVNFLKDIEGSPRPHWDY